ncbi:MAG: S26 family signal peptidase [Candidatus Taylorbacteria bacterium]|nr:S26 family signal peptidase [Candidatus Taylorbacteria bacterium]
MKRSQNGFAWNILIIIILLLLVSGGLYYFSQKTNSPTGDWETKIDTKSGITFKYPKDWSVINLQDLNNLKVNERNSYIAPKHLVFGVNTVGKYTSYEAYKNKTAYQAMNIESENELIVDGSKVIVIKFTTKIPGVNLEDYQYSIFKDNYIYFFSIEVNGKLSDEDIKILDEIISTLKLTSVKVADIYIIEGVSMTPTYKPGTNLVINNDYGILKKGQTIIFNIKPNNSSNNQPTKGVKRIVGLPNETVSITKGKILINGVEINIPEIHSTNSMGGDLAQIKLG